MEEEKWKDYFCNSLNSWEGGIVDKEERIGTWETRTTNANLYWDITILEEIIAGIVKFSV